LPATIPEIGTMEYKVILITDWGRKILIFIN